MSFVAASDDGTFVRLQVFCAHRQNTDAYLPVSLNTGGTVPNVLEPETHAFTRRFARKRGGPGRDSPPALLAHPALRGISGTLGWTPSFGPPFARRPQGAQGWAR